MPASKLAWPSLLASLIPSCGRVFRGLSGLVSLAFSSNALDPFAGKAALPCATGRDGAATDCKPLPRINV